MNFSLFPQTVWQWVSSLSCLTLFVLIVVSSFLFFIRMPGSSFRGPLPPLTRQEQQSSELLEKHVQTLAGNIGPRNIWRPSSLSGTVAYLEKVLTDLGYDVCRHEFSAYEVTALNLEVEISGSLPGEEMVVVGAHYDTVSGSPGANDNGSGVAVLLELARLLAESRPLRTIRLVAFANEEPPFFFSQDMGSRHYAAESRRRGEKIVAMLSLETMGYYRDEPGSQHYPYPFSFFYPDSADFIGFVGNVRSRHLVRQAIASFRRHTRFPSQGIAAPSCFPGIGWSDHWSFWREGYPAIMVTDTAFYRYAPYHTFADTAEKLDYERMARVVTGLVPTLLDIAGQE